MNLSQHFTLGEFTASSMAARHGVDNTPSQQIIEELKRTATLMEDVRHALCVPILITSGFRCAKLNKLVGGKPTSKHVQGLACDFKAPGYGDPMSVCKAIQSSGIAFGKLILEYYDPSSGNGWAHIEVGSECKILTINRQGVFSGLHV